MKIWAHFELDFEPSPLEFELSHAKQHTSTHKYLCCSSSLYENLSSFWARFCAFPTGIWATPCKTTYMNPKISIFQGHPNDPKADFCYKKMLVLKGPGEIWTPKTQTHFLCQKFSEATAVDLTPWKFEPFIPEVRAKKTGEEFRAKTNGKEFRVMLRQGAKNTHLKFKPRLPEVWWSNHWGSHPFQVWATYPRNSVETTTVDLTLSNFEPFIPEDLWSNHRGSYPFKVSATYPRSSVKQPLWILPI